MVETPQAKDPLPREAVYPALSKRFEGLRDQQYKLPSLFSALIGGLWFFGCQQVTKDRFISAAVFLFAVAVSLACLKAIYRFRQAFNMHLDTLNALEGPLAITLPKERFSRNRSMTMLLWIALAYSAVGVVYALTR